MASAFFYSRGTYWYSIVGAILILIKNYLDSLDGHLARAKGLVSRLGRFLDSLSDAVVYLFLFTALASNVSSSQSGTELYLLAYAAMLSAFLQCSVFNYYVVSYKTFLTDDRTNRTDERFSEEDKSRYKKGLSEFLLYCLQWIYQVVYGWQDRIVSSLDRELSRRFQKLNSEKSSSEVETLWYADKRFLSLVSPLCFGTQIVMLVIFTFVGNVEGFLWFVLIAGNAYTAIILSIKTIAPKPSI